MEFLLMIPIHYQHSARCNRSQYPVEHLKREIEDGLDWMRNDGVPPDDADSLSDFSKMESIPVSRRTPEERH